MQKTINFLKSWVKRIATHPTTERVALTFVEAFLGVLLAGIASTKSLSALWVLLSAAFAAGFSAAYHTAKNTLKNPPVNIPGEDA